MFPIEKLYRYPVKGFSAEPLPHVLLQAGQAFPLDRKFAITNGTWDFNASTYSPRPKTDFLTLLQHEELAEYRAAYDEEQNILTLISPDDVVHQFALDDLEDCHQLSMLMSSRLGSKLNGTPMIVEAKDIRFTDVSVVSTSMMNAVSLINLTSMDALAAAMSTELDPLRFRANIYFRGATAWEELSWVGQEIMIGKIRARVVLKTRRCAATNVNPATAQRDAAIPQTLIKTFRHGDLGVYAELIDGGVLEVGDYVTLIS